MIRYVLLVFAFGAVAAALTACANIDRTSWILTAQSGDSDTTLQLGVLLGGCDEFERFDVSETEVDITGQLIESVTIEAYIQRDVRSTCPANLLYEDRTVELAAPLGDRPLRGCSPSSAHYGPVRPDLPNDDCAASIFSAGGETDATEAHTRTPEPTEPEASSVTRTTGWLLTAEPQGASLHLVVEVGGDKAGCYHFERLDVTETSESVTVDAIGRHRILPAGWGCTTELKLEPHTVELRSPLGDRELLGCDPTGVYDDGVDRDCREVRHQLDRARQPALHQVAVYRHELAGDGIDREVHLFQGYRAEDRLAALGARDHLRELSLAVHPHPGATDLHLNFAPIG